jgi:hypothetical protein
MKVIVDDNELRLTILYRAVLGFSFSTYELINDKLAQPEPIRYTNFGFRLVIEANDESDCG